jgi:hypothetical protein
MHAVGKLNENPEERVSLPSILGSEQVFPKMQTPAGQPI